MTRRALRARGTQSGRRNFTGIPAVSRAAGLASFSGHGHSLSPARGIDGGRRDPPRSRSCSRFRENGMTLKFQRFEGVFTNGRVRDKQSGSRAWRKGFKRWASLVWDPRVGRQIGLVVEPEVAIVNLEGQRGEGRAVDATSFGSVDAVVRVPASGLVSGRSLQLDDAVANPAVPARPRLAAVLIHGQRAVIPVIEVRSALVRLVLHQVSGCFGARGAGTADAQELAANPGFGRHRGSRLPDATRVGQGRYELLLLVLRHAGHVSARRPAVDALERPDSRPRRQAAAIVRTPVRKLGP